MMLLLATAALAAEKVERKVTVDGSRYRVSWRGDEVEVASKGLIAVRSLRSRDRMRAAVLSATGCKLVDEMPVNAAVIQGKLDCGQ